MQTDSLEVLTKDDLVEWFMHPVTKKVRYKIEQEKAKITTEMGWGFTLHLESVDKTAMKTAREVGKIEGLEFVFNIEADNLIETNKASISSLGL